MKPREMLENENAYLRGKIEAYEMLLEKAGLIQKRDEVEIKGFGQGLGDASRN